MEKQGEEAVRTSKMEVEAVKRETLGYAEELNMDDQGAFQSNTQLASQIAQLQRSGNKYTSKIEKQQGRLKELEEEIKEMQQKIAGQRVELKRSQQNKDSNEELSRKIKSLENKLDKQLQKYNQAIGHNKQLREQIDSVRRERVVFDSIYKKLETELNEKKKTMVKIIEQAETAYHARESAKKEMMALKKNSEEEQKQFDEEWRKLSKLIEDDKQKKDFLKQDEEQALRALHQSSLAVLAPPTHTTSTQQQPAITFSPESTKIGPKASRGRSTQREVLQELEQEEKMLRQRVSATSWNTAKDSITIERTLAKVAQYEEAFRSIKEATGLASLEEIVELFVHSEEENFSLFNYVNELTAEIEGLENQIAETKAQILKYQHTGYIGKGDEEQLRLHQQLETRLKSAEKEAAQYEKANQETQKTMEQLKSGVQSIFLKIGCQPEAAGHPELVGADVSECNIATYLGIIEKRATQILSLYQSVSDTTRTALDDENSSLATGSRLELPPVNIAKRALSLDPPDLTRFGPQEAKGRAQEEEGIPLTEKDLKEKALRFFARKYEQGDLSLGTLDKLGRLK